MSGRNTPLCVATNTRTGAALGRYTGGGIESQFRRALLVTCFIGKALSDEAVQDDIVK
jgi:hypothetical protein